MKPIFYPPPPPPHVWGPLMASLRMALFRKSFRLLTFLTLVSVMAAELLFGGNPAAAQSANSAPAFANASETRDVKENRARGSVVGAPVTATDADNDSLYYSLSGADAATFTIDEASGQIRLTRPLDYESRASYSVTVGASDRKDAGGNAESAPGAVDATVPVAIKVVDVSTAREEYVVDSEFGGDPESWAVIVELDPSPPIFDEIEDIRSVRTGEIVRTIDESAPLGSTVGAPVVARDPEQAGPVTYRLVNQHLTPRFSIDSSTGQLTTIGELDYESARHASVGTGRVYLLAVSSTDAEGHSLVASVDVYVRNVSGEPAAPGNLVVTPIKEGLDVSWNAVAGATGYRVEWRRMLYGPSVHLTWHEWGILSPAALAPSSATSYRISGLKPHTPYQVRVSAKNGVGYGAMAFDYGAWRSQIPTGDPHGCVPGNNPPFFTEGDTTPRNVADGTPAGGNIGAPIAVTLDHINGFICYDPELDKPLTYSLDTTTGDHADFNVDAATGQLSTVSTLDRSVKDAYSVTLRVTDGKSQWDDADPSIDDSIVVTINVTSAVAQAQQSRATRNTQESASAQQSAPTPQPTPAQQSAPAQQSQPVPVWAKTLDCSTINLDTHPSGLVVSYCEEQLAATPPQEAQPEVSTEQGAQPQVSAQLDVQPQVPVQQGAEDAEADDGAGGTPDAGADDGPGGTPDAVVDDGADGTPDAGADADDGPDGTPDAGADADDGPDGTPDAGADAGADGTPGAGADAGDADDGPDGTPDAGADDGPDGTPDAAALASVPAQYRDWDCSAFDYENSPSGVVTHYCRILMGK